MIRRIFICILIILLSCGIFTGCAVSDMFTVSTSNNFKVGRKLWKNTWEMHFTAYSAKGTSTHEFTGKADATLYDHRTSSNSEDCYLRFFLEFNTDDYLYKPTRNEMINGYIYDSCVTGLITAIVTASHVPYSVPFVLDPDRGIMICLYAHENKYPVSLLVGSADGDMQPDDVIAHFEGYIKDAWPEWWENYQQSNAT